MPPPSTVDAWLHGRRFGIVIDAGSSGSRLQIYSWQDARIVRQEHGPEAYYSLPQVGKGTENPDDWVRKVDPGISSFADNPEDIAVYLAPLLDHAREHIPPSLHHETPIFLLATAGMRLLPTTQQDSVLNAACDFIRLHSHFKVEDSSSLSSRCGSNIRIISGEEEGLFGWIAVNYLMDQFTGNDDDRTTFGFLDMGGASTQIAFEPSEEERAKAKNLIDVRLRLVGGEEVHHQVFVTTWLGYGTNQARERYVGKVVAKYEILEETADGHIPDPCLPRNLELVEKSTHIRDDARDKEEHTLVGTGAFEQCLKQVAPLLNKDAPCPDSPCLFNGVHVPQIDFSVSHFIGVSEYWYSSEHVFGLGGPYNFEEFERAASRFCARDWDDIMRQHTASKSSGDSNGEDKLEGDSQPITLDQWGDEVEISRLQMQCFKSAWIVNVLHEGIGMPRIVDPGGDLREDSSDVKEKVDQKGLGKPTMQSLDSIGDTSISWTLGKMVLEASREVPPLSKDTPPLPEPIVGTHSKGPDSPFDTDPNSTSNSTPLPTEEILELSYFVVLSYLACFTVISIIAFRLRHPILRFLRPFLRKVAGREVAGDNDLEGGYAYNSKNGRFSSVIPLLGFPLSHSNSRLWMYTRSFLSRILASLRRRPTSPPSSSSPGGHHTYSSASRASPARSFSPPSLRIPSSFAGASHYANSPHGGSIPPRSIPPRSATPPSNRLDPSQPNGRSSPTLYSLPRSRNNSQMNLTMLVTRQTISRSGSSGQQTPTSLHHDVE